MCGIYGAVFSPAIEAETRQAVLRLLAILNESRGHHSAGLAVIKSTTGKHKLYKRAGRPTAICRHAGWRRIIDWANGEWATVIGHARWATHGAHTDANAHPFRVGNTIGAHNGVCANLDEMSASLGGKKYDVDSQYLVAHLEHDGTLGQARGSLNVAYWQKSWVKSHTLLKIIKAGNPLHWFDNGECVIYSSERSHLVTAVDAAYPWLKTGQVYSAKDDYTDVVVWAESRVVKSGIIENKPIDCSYTVTSANWDTGGRSSRSSRSSGYGYYDADGAYTYHSSRGSSSASKPADKPVDGKPVDGKPADGKPAITAVGGSPTIGDESRQRLLSALPGAVIRLRCAGKACNRMEPPQYLRDGLCADCRWAQSRAKAAGQAYDPARGTVAATGGVEFVPIASAHVAAPYLYVGDTVRCVDLTNLRQTGHDGRAVFVGGLQYGGEYTVDWPHSDMAGGGRAVWVRLAGVPGCFDARRFVVARSAVARGADGKPRFLANLEGRGAAGPDDYTICD